MATARIERRLAAILAADVAGYSRLMERDEDRTLERLKAHRKEFIEPLIAEYQGRVVKLMGDGALVEFASVVDAVRSASGTSYDHLQGKLDLPLEFAGEQRVKNIERLVRAYRVRLDGTAVRFSLGRARRFGRRAAAAALALFLLVVASGGWWWHQSREPARTSGLPTPTQPSIAVLPLANLSGDARWERLADGLTEDIITDLARTPDLVVIARNSTMPYKGKPVDVRQVGRELGVRHVLEGSLQAEAGRVRVTAQLIDATNGSHLWAERYDRPEAELFAVQDEVARSVATALGGWYGKLHQAQRVEARRRPPASLEAYDLFLLGLEQKHQYTRVSMQEAIRLLSRAVELDPGFAKAWLMLGIAHSMAASSGFVDDPRASVRAWVECVRKAAALDPYDAHLITHLGWVSALEGDQKEAEQAFDRALAMGPSDANALSSAAWGLPLLFGKADEAVPIAQRAMALDPAGVGAHAPALVIAHYVAGRYEEAVAASRLAPLEGGEMLMFYAMAQAQLGHAEEARKAAERIRTEFPSFTVENYIRDAPVTSPKAQEAIRDGAAKAGLLSVATQ